MTEQQEGQQAVENQEAETQSDAPNGATTDGDSSNTTCTEDTTSTNAQNAEAGSTENAAVSKDDAEKADEAA